MDFGNISVWPQCLKLIEPLPVTGQKEADHDSAVWDDYNPDVAGDMDDHVDDPDCQDGFSWNCCDGKLGSVGCKRTRHRATNPGEKKGRN